MTTKMSDLTALALASIAPLTDYDVLLDVSDTSTSPADASGSNKKATVHDKVAAALASITQATTTAPGLYVYVTGDTNARIAIGLNTSDSPRISAGPGNAVRDTFYLVRAGAAATFQWGDSDAAAPVAQKVQVQSVAAGTANTAGAAFTIAGSKGTGTGAGGVINFAIALAGSTGTAQNAHSTAWQITGAGNLIPGANSTYSIGASGNYPAMINASQLSNPTGAMTLFHANGDDIRIRNNTSTTAFLGFYNSSATQLFQWASSAANTMGLMGATSSFPGIGRSTTRIVISLGDGTAGGGINFSTAAVLSIASGTNQRAGDATLVGGTVTISNTTITANTRVFVTRKTAGGTIGMSVTYTVSAGASFTLTSDNVLDTSVYSYLLVEVP